MDPALAACIALGLALALVGSVLGALAYARADARAQEARAGAAELELQRGRADRAEALAEHRRLRLVEAAARAVRKAGGAAADAAHAARLDAALADAGGDVDAAVELLLAGGRDPARPGGAADAPGAGGAVTGDGRGPTLMGAGPAGGPPRG